MTNTIVYEALVLRYYSNADMGLLSAIYVLLLNFRCHCGMVKPKFEKQVTWLPRNDLPYVYT